MSTSETPQNLFDDVLEQPPALNTKDQSFEPVEVLAPGPTGVRRLVQPLAWVSDERFIYQVKRGGMGVVWLCGSKSDDGGPITASACKTFYRNHMHDPYVRAAFRDECATWFRLSSIPGIFPAQGLVEFGKQPFVEMPVVVPGVMGEISLRDLVALGPLPLSKVILFSIRVATTMASACQAEEGLLHRDLKPENLLIWMGLPYISDFGLARSLRTGPGNTKFIGTPGYIAPEIASNRNADSPTADIYAFGVIMREMLTGTRQADIRHRNESAISSDEDAHIVEDLWRMAQRCSSEDWRERPENFTLIAASLIEIFSTKEWEFDRDVLNGWTFMQFLPGLSHIREATGGARGIAASGDRATILDRTENLGDDSYPEFHVARASALIDEGRLDEAEEQLDLAAQKVNPSNYDKIFQINSEYSILCKRRGLFAKAREAAAIGVEIAQKTSDPAAHTEAAFVNWTGIVIDSGDFEGALYILTEGLKAFPRSANLWAQMGSLAAQMDDYENAVAALQRATKLDPANGKHHLMAARILSNAQSYDGALQEYELAARAGYADSNHLAEMLAISILAPRQPRNRFISFAEKLFGETIVKNTMPEARRIVSSFPRG